MKIKYHEFEITNTETGEGHYVLREREATEEEIARLKEMKTPKPAARIASLKRLLAESDYKAIKYAEGFIPEDEYAPVKSQRQAWRDEINLLEGEE